jgi:hypothetical protein
MESLFESIYPYRRSVSPSELQLMLKLFRQDLMTVLLEISYSSEDKIFLLMSSGKISCVYHAKEDRITRYPLSDLSTLFQSRDGAIRVCELASSSFGAVRTTLEQSHSSSILSSSTTELPGIIQKWQAMPEPSLAHIRWPNAEGFVFIPGNHFSARQYAFVAEGRSSDSAAAVSMFSRWSEAECTISQYTSDSQLEIWRENNLQLGFALLIEQIMRRYEDLVGHLLSRKLESSLSRLSQTKSWSISIADTTVDDVQLFDSVDDAATAYRMLLDLASRQISAVIGPRLFDDAVDAGMVSLGDPLRQAVENNHLVATLAANFIRG